MADNPRLIQHRARKAQAAIVFVHGFGGNANSTWGRFPEFLMVEGKDLVEAQILDRGLRAASCAVFGL